MPFEVHRKYRITDVELEEAVALCTRAYAGELASDSMVGGDEKLKDPIFRAMIRAGETDGQVWLTTDSSSNKVVAVAVCFPPGKSLFDSEEQRALGFDDFMKQLSPETRAFWDNVYVPEVTRFLAEIMGPTGTRDCQYLDLLATDPSFQNKGIATMLLKSMENQILGTDTVQALCAMNEGNARFYQAFGYTGSMSQ
ncbi:hypothetical protein C8R44DRAFT_792212 [Mycena epipterygia]|nr:hypothetical protein C8R44DRAFT_792212 [Mycena epipterygia]